MTYFIINAIIWTLALYGLVEIIKNIYYIFTYTNLKASGIYLIIAVKNQQDQIEGFLRTALFRIIYGKEDIVKDIIVTDLDSNDETKIILEKLAKDYDNLKIMNWKECREIVENIEKTDVAQ